MRVRATPVAVLVIAALTTGFAVWKATGAVVVWWNAGPNYTPAPTASCLRGRGYGVSWIRRGTRRNVATNLEVAVSEADPVLACLRTQ